MPTAASLTTDRRMRMERLWLLLVLLAVGVWVGVARLSQLQALETDESARLAVQAGAMERNLAQQLRGVRAALQGVREDLPGWPSAERSLRVGRRLHALAEAQPGVQGMLLVDAQGRRVAASGPDGLPDDVAGSDWFHRLQAQPEPQRLVVSAPQRLPDGGSTLTLAIALTDDQGALQGAVAANLDPAYLESLADSLVYAAGTATRIVHADGGLLIVHPADAAGPAAGAAAVDPAFARHLASGLAASVLRGPPRPAADDQLVALRTLQPPALQMDRALVVAVSRNLPAIRAPWLLQTELVALLYLGGTLSAAAALWALQRRRSERGAAAAASEARQAADAERLRLALHGGDLALWDADVPGRRATVNARWAEMLGYAPGEVSADADGWEALLHPDDRERVLALEAEHLAGRSPQFEATYRLRHRAGHWIWVLDRGRVVERDASGAALRMVGTHMDISARVQAEETLRRSEQSLAVTLQSIGDAVIATDAAGLITRINDAARRLTGWPGDSALARPLAEVFCIYRPETQLRENDPVARVLASGGVVGLAQGTRLVARDGSEYRIADSAAPIRTADGQVLGVVLVFSDVSEQYRMLQALRHSEQKSRALLAALRSGVVVYGPDARVLDANPSACRFLGLTLDQLQGRAAIDPGWALLEENGQEMPASRHPVQQVLAGTDPVRSLVVGLRRPGLNAPRWALCTAFALRDDAGALQEVVVTLYEITERKLAEEALQHSAARLRLAGRLARLGGWRLDLASGRLELSAEAAAVAGVGGPPPETLPEMLRLVAPAHRETLAAALQRREAFDMEIEAHTQAGQARLLRVLGEPSHDELGRVLAMQGAVQDVTESRRSQQQLRLLDTAVAQLNDMVLITEAAPLAEPGPRIVFVNAAFERQTGWSREQVLGRSPRMLQSPATNRAELARVRDALQRNEPVRAELLNVTQQGRSYWVDVQIAPLFDANGHVTHMVAVERDISDRKASEAAARAAQEALAATLAAVPDLLFELDIDGQVHVCHTPRSELLYAPPEAFLGRRVYDLLPPAAADCVALAVREAHEQGYSGGRQYELLLGDAVHWFELSVARKATAPGVLPRVIALARDITERKLGEAQRAGLERQLREAQKIESIGTLAGGIAHDFNNILPAILGNVALALQDLPADHAAHDSLLQIRHAGLRARTLVQQILTFSRRQPQALVAQPLQPVLNETLSLLRATLPAAVRLDVQISADPAPVEVDATQLQQVLMNLCTNAWHALPEGRGRIEVGLALVDAGEAARLGGEGRTAGHCMHLWVSDDGCGMDAATRERIFDPFFTTKPVGQGTGLGLSVVHGIVRGHHGRISVDSTPGLGSSFHVLLPLARGRPTEPAALDEAGVAAGRGRGEQVWYVDDDEVMSLMVQRLLQREGYEVSICGSGGQALARARSAEAPPALVVTDYNMPEISGLELAAQLVRLWPRLPIVLTSGYIADTLQAEARQHGVRALLRKENTLEELPLLVRRLLGTAAAG